MPDDQGRLLDDSRQKIGHISVKTIALNIIFCIFIFTVYFYCENLFFLNLNKINILLIIIIFLLLNYKWATTVLQALRQKLNLHDIKKQIQSNFLFSHDNLQTTQYITSLQEEIKSRTLDLNKLRVDLEKKQAHWILAHKISGFTPWCWDIQNHKIKLTNYFDSDEFEEIYFNKDQMDQHIHPDDLNHFSEQLISYLDGIENRFEVTYRLKNAENEWIWTYDIGYIVEKDPISQQAVYMTGVRRNIHKERQAQERLKLTATVLKQATEGIVVLDKNFHYIEINPFFEQLSGLTRAQIIGQYLFDITQPVKNQQINQHKMILHKLLECGSYACEIHETFISGKSIAIRLHINAVKNEENIITNYIAILHDISKQKHQEQRLSYLEHFDTLTDLPNRASYHEQLADYVAINAISIEKLAILRLNIDRFRPLSKFLSQLGSDELLRQFSQRLRMRTSDAIFLAYLDNDNFALVYELSHIRPSIENFCYRINEIIKSPFIINNKEIYITLSIGVAFYPTDSHDLDHLHNCAEQALTTARNLGGDSIQYYVNQKTLTAKDYNIELEHDLRNSIKNHHLEIHYQPKILFKTGKIQGFEALIRWKHPIQGYIAPSIFIPIAEQSSLISELGQFVIQEVAKQVKIWERLGFQHIRIALNVAAQQLHRLNLISTLEQAMIEHEIPSHCLEIELTESSLFEKSPTIEHVLQELKARNIHLTLDDFGTGYSSLSYLSNFPIDTIKIDQSFICKVGESKAEAVIIAIIAMSKAMGMQVVAEGIETKQQFDFLKQLDCDIAQGYFFSKPLPSDQATEFLKSHHTKSLIPF